MVVLVMLFFFVRPFFGQLGGDTKAFSRKKSLKKTGSRPSYDAEMGRFLPPPRSGLSEVVGTLLKLRLRRHLPRGFILVAMQSVEYTK